MHVILRSLIDILSSPRRRDAMRDYRFEQRNCHDFAILIVAGRDGNSGAASTHVENCWVLIEVRAHASK